MRLWHFSQVDFHLRSPPFAFDLEVRDNSSITIIRPTADMIRYCYLSEPMSRRTSVLKMDCSRGLVRALSHTGPDDDVLWLGFSWLGGDLRTHALHTVNMMITDTFDSAGQVNGFAHPQFICTSVANTAVCASITNRCQMMAPKTWASG